MESSERLCITALEGDFVHTFVDESFRTLPAETSDRLNAVAVAAAWVTLLCDTPICDRKPRRVLHQFVTSLEQDLAAAIRLYKRLANELISSESIADGMVFSSFISGFNKTPVAREYHFYLRTKNPEVFQYLLSFCKFASKFEFDRSDIEDSALRAWLDIETDLGELTLPTWVGDLKPFICFFLQTWDDRLFLPRHGPGAVVEKARGVSQKNRAFTANTKLLYTYGSRSGYDALDPRGVPLGDTWSSEERHVVRKSSALLFVPKDIDSLRTICEEPIDCQWAQQAVDFMLRSAMKEGPLAKYVDLNRQRINSSAAEFGSMTNLVDTIDLSSASDCVSRDLVRAISPRRFYDICSPLALHRATYEVMLYS